MLLTQVEYSVWASRKLLAAAGSLSEEELARDLGTAHHSIAGTFAHIMQADRIWLSRLDGAPRVTLADPGEDQSLAATEKCWNPVLDRFLAWIRDLKDPEALLHYRNTKGEPFEAPIRIVVSHVVNHATYHRGQIAGMFRQIGKAPPGTDLIYWHLGRANR